MVTDTKQDELKSLRIDKSRRSAGQPSNWARRFILIGIGFVVLLGLVALAYRAFMPELLEVEVTRAQAENSAGPATVLSAGGYIVAHHKINVNSKVTGRIAWIGVEKGDKVKEGQVLVRLENQEFRAQVEQSRGAVMAAEAQLKALETGSRPQEVEQAKHNLEQARANLQNAEIWLERSRALAREGVVHRQQVDDAVARHDSAQQQVKSLEKAYELVRIGPRAEEIERARGNLLDMRGRLAYTQTLLEATQIRAPVSGTILERTAEKGELVTAQFASGAEGGPRGSVVSLADLNDLQVELDISQDDFAKLSPRQQGVVTADAYPDRKYQGMIDEISPEANRQKATVQVKVKVLNPDEYLRPEMNAKVEFLPSDTSTPATAAAAGVIVPAAAVRDRDGRKMVFIAFNGKALVREVRVRGQRSGSYVVEGLTGGEDVIINPPANLREGDGIKVKGR
ncbi:MAG: efflux RND transporter periplasmic adaptor subunit [Acidobacteria bacterium]|nr:efflux RND transporter periplasmic adaptor subunit [Acidobacteriota bacterium]